MMVREDLEGIGVTQLEYYSANKLVETEEYNEENR
jgi:hypothetical protein